MPKATAQTKTVRLRRARSLLRQVDEQLFRFGPRRALERLTLLKTRAPDGTCRLFGDYQKVLEAMQQRRSALHRDIESEMADDIPEEV